MGQLVQVPGERRSARQLLRSKAETEVLKRLAVAQGGSNPKGSILSGGSPDLVGQLCAVCGLSQTICALVL